MRQKMKHFGIAVLLITALNGLWLFAHATDGLWGDTNKNPWSAVNIVLVVLFAVFVVALVFRLLRRKELTRMTNVDSVIGIMNEHKLMEQALADEEFFLYFQPKVSLKTEKMEGAEVLVRWYRVDQCMPPYHFIPCFEKNGFIEQLDYYVLEKACIFLQNHQKMMRGRLSVNISGVTLQQDRVVQTIVGIVDRYQISTTQIDLEITETAFVDTSDVLEKVQQLHGYGFTISMDDFGAGVSSLNRLKNIYVDTLKIDREFIIDAIENPRGKQILKHVIQMANDLNLETVAEGIETVEQGDLLQRLGCRSGQGYYYARPMPEAQFVAYCKKACAQGA